MRPDPLYDALLDLAGALDALASQIDLDALPGEGEAALRSARIAYAALVIPPLQGLESLLGQVSGGAMWGRNGTSLRK